MKVSDIIVLFGTLIAMLIFITDEDTKKFAKSVCFIGCLIGFLCAAADLLHLF